MGRRRGHRHIRRRNGPGAVIVLLLLAILAEVAVLGRLLSDGRADIPALSRAVSLLRREQEPEDWRLLLVNGDNPLPEDYEIEYTELLGGVLVDSRIYPDLQRMFDDARAAGIDPVVSEGWRSHGDQERMMQTYVGRYTAQGYSQAEAETLAAGYVAQPGTSEHELGIAVDINAAPGGDSQAVYDWLSENAHLYGFILRYPAGKEDITGYDYEPWHYRYVGLEAAGEIYAEGLTLEEYLDR